MPRTSTSPPSDDPMPPVIDARDLTLGHVVRFTIAVALLAIFFDASIAHGILWENDPYWTYWITKTFLIATIFGLGTAWFGVGLVRGAVITAVHSLVLTIYYWTFSPIGLPSHPEWLDLEHTWGTGMFVHYGVIYLGYLVALWLHRRRFEIRRAEPVGARGDATAALLMAVAIGGLSLLLTSIALGDFPGVTWLLVRLLITVPFLLVWWATAGTDRTSAVTGAIMLALIWTTYGQYLGPNGLPDTPLRILGQDPPPATVHWLDYRQLWLMSFPIYLAVAAVVMLVGQTRLTRRPA